MSDIRLDEESGDLEIINGDLVITEGSDATRQRLLQALRFFRGEWFLDLSRGVPYYQNILVKNPNPLIIESVLKQTILDVQGVLELTQFDLNYDNSTRKLALDFEVRTSEGLINFSEIFGG